MNMFIVLGIGLAAAVIDVLPMILKRVDPLFIASAAGTWIGVSLLAAAAQFVPYGWLNGIIVAGIVVVPILFLILRLDRGALPQIVVTTLLLGAAVGELVRLAA